MPHHPLHPPRRPSAARPTSRRARLWLCGGALAWCSLALPAQEIQAVQEARVATETATRPADAPATAAATAAWQALASTLEQQFPNVHSAVVLHGGQQVLAYYRDGDAQLRRDTQSVAKSALSALVGRALVLGHVRSLDQRVVELVPDWTALNTDPRAARITLRHLLTMSTGFAIDDPSGTARGLPARTAWARPLGSEPGTRFAYDNSVMALLTAVLEAATGQPLVEFARAQLVTPLGLAEPQYTRFFGIHLRTQDMARLGQLYLQNGAWQGQQLLPADFVQASGVAHNAGGPPARLAYGYLWWVLSPLPALSPAGSTAEPVSTPVPTPAPRPYFANGYGGQYIWVDAAQQLVIATTSPLSPDAQQRAQSLQWIHRHVYPTVQRLARDAAAAR